MNVIKTVAFAALMVSASAFAGDKTTTTTNKTTTTTTVKVPEFRSLDTDGDGVVSKAELSANTELSAKFDTLDVNQDGSISTSEYAKSTGKDHSAAH